MSNTTFTDDVALQLDDYNPFSILALMALLFAIFCCILAIFNGQLVAFPVLSALFGAFALYRLYSRGMRRGYLMAGVALLASIFVFSGILGYQTLRFTRLQSLANQYCDEWLELIKDGKTLEAYQLTVDFHEREEEGTDLSRIYGSVENPQPGLATYLKLEPEKSIRDLGANAKIRSGEKTDYFRVDYFHERFECHRFLDRSHESKDDFHFVVIMERTRPLEADIYWEVVGIVNISPKIPRSERQIGPAGPGGNQRREMQ